MLSDLQAWDFRTPNGVMVTAAVDGRLVSGIERLAQDVLMRILTEQESIRYPRRNQPTYGTRFMTQFYANEFHADSDLRVAFDHAMILVKSQLRSAEELSLEEWDAADRLASAKVQQIVLTPNEVQLVILIQSQTDAELLVVLPLPTE